MVSELVMGPGFGLRSRVRVSTRGGTASPTWICGEPAACDLVQSSSSSLLKVLVLMSRNVPAYPRKKSKIWGILEILYKTVCGNPLGVQWLDLCSHH